MNSVYPLFLELWKNRVRQKSMLYRTVVSTGSKGSIEPVDFWKRHNGTFDIAKIMRIETVNFQDMDLNLSFFRPSNSPVIGDLF